MTDLAAVAAELNAAVEAVHHRDIAPANRDAWIRTFEEAAGRALAGTAPHPAILLAARSFTKET